MQSQEDLQKFKRLIRRENLKIADVARGAGFHPDHLAPCLRGCRTLSSDLSDNLEAWAISFYDMRIRDLETRKQDMLETIHKISKR